MEILEIIADASLSGGPKHVFTLVKKLSKYFKITTVCPQGHLAKQLQDAALEKKIINFEGAFDLSSIRALRAYVKINRPKLVHAHGIRAGIATYFAITFLPTKLVYTEHLYTDEYHLTSVFREFMQTFFLGLVCRRSKVVIAPSMAVKKFLIGRFSIEDSKIQIVANGLDDFHFPFKKLLHPTVGFVGGSGPTKGLPLLLSAMSIVGERNPDIRLQIVGAVDKSSRRLLENCEFLGADVDVEKTIGSWRTLMVPSTTESFGQVILEAAIVGIPVIATKAGALPEIVHDLVNGFLVEKTDVKGLAEAIIRVVTDEKAAKMMGEKNRQLYERNFTSDIMSLKVKEIYDKVIKNESKSNS